MGMVSAVALAAFVGVRAETVETKTKARTGCDCCGSACACPACTCDAKAKAARSCDCCGTADCCAAGTETTANAAACCH
jgi:hypothetical protein